ncbi:MAG: hypothetical protein A2020_08170 [Lentisphaerae bacterium GWF2_45_14]|nr:MAG: hypothetical protein A2020_08170 [Lentisphaerae bacterium GWF2_45_14]
MKQIGFIRTKTSREIQKSKIGIGLECLDRQMWDDSDEHYRLIGELGVKHARIQSGWSRCEVEKGKYDFAWLDRTVDKLQSAGIQPWMSLSYGNMHYTDAKEPDAVGWVPLFSESAKTGWKNYVAALVQHFSNRITHYEIWNEPDASGFWRPGKPNPEEYMELVRLTVPVVKENQPDAKIIAGALSQGLRNDGMVTLECLLKMGFAKLIDIYTYHRYRVLPEQDRPERFNALRLAFDAFDGKHVKFWQGEGGFPSKNSKTQALSNVPMTEDIQAKLLSKAIVNELALGVDYTCYFHFSDFKFYYRDGFCDVPNFFGLTTFDIPPRVKPAYHVLQRICSVFDGDVNVAPRSLIEIYPNAERDEIDRFMFHEIQMNIKTVCFERNGKALCAWWTPLSLVDESSAPYPHLANIHVLTPGLDLEDPVIVDLVTGEVFEPEKIKKMTYVIVYNVPVRDYPLIVVDRSAIDMTLI